ncbi:hypothetical protein [Rickettsiales endosymbiont of Trichoplax sp. H2]|uniref:hypothetical protein n=1 Tax=Rickettsiales endosymbiont of Trichoplax sp. H2 TaxID=2021221 RepID=UPI001DE16975|nr:hypothetical protein [Rickettsiales endosymbiont of Trichoplax sp. H2]MSO14387.1 hypothetical protein [Rickettsiales endosymbiont of Trichoplax sp. H2]
MSILFHARSYNFNDIMDKVEFIELLKNNTLDMINKAFEYTTQSIIPDMYMGKNELVVFGLIVLIVIFYYITTHKNSNKSK